MWSSELNGNIIMNCEQGRIYRGRTADCWNVKSVNESRGLNEIITVAGILGGLRTRYSTSTFLDIHSRNKLLRTWLRQLKLEIKDNIA